jgi:hypothetical protein
VRGHRFQDLVLDGALLLAFGLAHSRFQVLLQLCFTTCKSGVFMSEKSTLLHPF